MSAVTKLGIILSHIVRLPQFYESVRTFFTLNNLNAPNELIYKLIYAVAIDWYKSSNTAMPEVYLRTNICSRIEAAPTLFTTSALEELANTLDYLYTIELAPASAYEYLREFTVERHIKPTLTTLGTTPGMSIDFGKELLSLIDKYNRTKYSTAASLDSLLTPQGAEIVVSNKPTPTGVAFVDLLMGGGVAPAQIYGLLGPTGGGKTTLAIQIACSFAMIGKLVAYLSYEGDPKVEIIPRIYSFWGDLTRDEVKNYSGPLTEMPDNRADQLIDRLTRFGMNLKVENMSYGTGTTTSGSGGPTELYTKIKEIEDKTQRHVDLIIVDQIWSMVDYYLSAHSIPLDKLRFYINSFIEQMRAYTQETHLNTSILVLHQVANVVKQRSPITLPKKGDAAECRNFENNMHFCLELGVLDPKTNCCWCANPKARNAREDALIIHLDEQIWRFNYEPGAWRPGNGHFVKVSALNDLHKIDTNEPDDNLNDTLKALRL